MEFRFMPAALAHWDEASETIETLALSFFADERPLRGVAGLADWRLCGRLSRLITAGHCSGEEGESLMMPAGRKLPFERIMLFGLGRAEGLDETRVEQHAHHMLDVLHKAVVKNYAVQVPGRASGVIGARRGAEIWQRAARGKDATVTLLDAEGTQKIIGDLVSSGQS